MFQKIIWNKQPSNKPKQRILLTRVVSQSSSSEQSIILQEAVSRPKHYPPVATTQCWLTIRAELDNSVMAVVVVPVVCSVQTLVTSGQFENTCTFPRATAAASKHWAYWAESIMASSGRNITASARGGHPGVASSFGFSPKFHFRTAQQPRHLLFLLQQLRRRIGKEYLQFAVDDDDDVLLLLGITIQY